MTKITKVEQEKLNEVNAIFGEIGGKFYPDSNEECIYGLDNNPNNDKIILTGYITTFDGVVVAEIQFNEIGEDNRFIIEFVKSQCSLEDDNYNDEIKLIANLYNNRKNIIDRLMAIDSRLLM